VALAEGGHPAYAGSKLALARWVRRSAPGPEWAGAGVRLNAVAPGAVLTPLLREGLEHPVLGERLLVLTQIVNTLEGRSVEQIFGYPDDLKFHSSMTLFAHAARDKTPFETALNTYFGGEPDPGTVARLT